VTAPGKCSCGCGRDVAGRLERPDLAEACYRRYLRGGRKPGPPPPPHHRGGRHPWAPTEPVVPVEPDDAELLDVTWMTGEARCRVMAESLHAGALRSCARRRDAAGARAVWLRVEDAEAVRVLLATGGDMRKAVIALTARIRRDVTTRRAA
jgi:hypothetical protein